jgi:hypothetical protein
VCCSSVGTAWLSGLKRHEVLVFKHQRTQVLDVKWQQQLHTSVAGLGQMQGPGGALQNSGSVLINKPLLNIVWMSDLPVSCCSTAL